MGKKKTEARPPRQPDNNDFNYLRDKFQPAFEYKPADPHAQGKTEYHLGDLVVISTGEIGGTVVSILGRILGVIDRKGRIHYVKDFEVYRAQPK